jgi:diguanylate cyclase (GGDEF)-like protein
VRSTTRTRQLLAALALAALLIGGLAYNVVHSQARARAGIEQEFGRRAALAAGLTTAAFNSTADQWKQGFSGPRSSLPQAMEQLQSYNADSGAAVLDARGRLLVTWPLNARRPAFLKSPTARRALAGRLSISDIDGGGPGQLLAGIPFDTPSGRRVALELLPSEIIASFARAYLASAPAIRGGRGYLIDGNSRVLAASVPVRSGSPLPDRGLAAALRGHSAGSSGGRYYAASALAGTRWRVVLTASHDRLLAPVQGSTKRTAWMLFAAFVAALAALVAVGLRALRSSSQLVAAHERERAAQRLAHERLHDALTGLPNRVLFLDRADNALALAERSGQALAVLFVDLDRFKRINDSLGHASGDTLLTAVAERLNDAVRAGDTVSRFGGDEFLVLSLDVDGADGALHLAQRITAALAQPFRLGDRSVHVSCCVGIALHLPGADLPDAAALVRDADAAMYRAKAEGQGRVRLFDAALHGEALTRLDTETALRDAIGDGELRVHYQPIVALPGGELRGVEALVRWERPGVGLVAPLEFIGLAEECGLIGELGHWVLSTAMNDVAGWSRAGLIERDFVLSVNVSARQLTGSELPGIVAGLLETWTLAPAQLWLEITETAVASDPVLAQSEIRALAALGVRVALDDFGVGQSSLEQLMRALPVDILKLDRSFTGHLEDGRERAVIAAIAPMAEALEMTAVAEGVETAAQAEELSMLGYPLAQGFHFGRPVAAGDMRALLACTALPLAT